MKANRPKSTGGNKHRHFMKGTDRVSRAHTLHGMWNELRSIAVATEKADRNATKLKKENDNGNREDKGNA